MTVTSARAATYVVAVTDPPPIRCPPWCCVSFDEHVADLPKWEGLVIHWSANRDAGPGCGVRIASTTHPDGTPDRSEGTNLFIKDAHFHDGAGLEAAERFARGILAAVQEARA